MKHGIHFRTAVKVFLDPNMLIREDEEHRFPNSGIYEMDLEFTFFPALPRLADLRVASACGKGFFPVRQAQGGSGKD